MVDGPSIPGRHWFGVDQAGAPASLRSAALVDLAALLRGRGLTVADDVDLPADDEPSAPTDALVLRIAQEALRNVVKRARASHARVSCSGSG